MALFSGKASGKKHEVQPEPKPAPVPVPNVLQASSKPGSPSDSRAAQQGGVTVANIGKSIAINGDLTGNEDMVIEGTVEGSIDLPNNELTIGANGSIKAEIHAKSVIVVGHVVGNINGIERVEIQGTGRVEGNVSAPKFVVAEGAQIDGAIHMTGSEGTSKPSSAKPTPAPNESAGEVRKTA